MIKKIYYINLDKRLDRNKHTLNEIKKLDIIDVERVTAIDGKTLDIKNISNNLITLEGKDDALDNTKGLYYILTKGAIGCALSHLAIYNKVIDELLDDEYALILEDDIYIDDDITNKLKYYINKIPKFDILFLGYHNHSDSIEYDDYGILGKIWGLFGYIINKKAAIEIKKIFPLRYQIDTEMPKIFKNLNVFYLKEQLIKSDVSQNTNAQFPTDTQTRELFNNVDDSRSNDYILLILLLLLILIIKFKIL